MRGIKRLYNVIRENGTALQRRREFRFLRIITQMNQKLAKFTKKKGENL